MSSQATSPAGIDKVSNAGTQTLSILLQLEAEARRAPSLKALQFLIVNETRRLIRYRQAVLVTMPRADASAMTVEAVSSVAVVERDAPMMQWLEGTLAALGAKLRDAVIAQVGQSDIPGLPQQACFLIELF